MTSSNSSSSAVRSSAKHAAERIQQHLPPNSNHALSLSSASLNLPSRTSIIAPGVAHSSRLKDRPSASSVSNASSVSASSPSTRRSGTPVRRSQSKDFDDDNGLCSFLLLLSSYSLLYPYRLYNRKMSAFLLLFICLKYLTFALGQLCYSQFGDC